MKKITCNNCNTEMRFFTNEQIQLGKTGWILGDLPNLISGALDVDVFICPECNKLEFYAAHGSSSAKEINSDKELPQKVCPKCGTLHDFDYPKCPRCKYDYAN